ncbi:hypothetical protein AB0N31_09580 [Streptomyces sp. NPDC051051]
MLVGDGGVAEVFAGVAEGEVEVGDSASRMPCPAKYTSRVSVASSLAR